MWNIKTTTQTPPLHSAKIGLQLVPGTEADTTLALPVGIDSYAENIVLMAAGVGTAHSPSGLREHTAGACKMAPDFKKAKRQFRPVFFSYFPFQDLCKSSSGGMYSQCTANQMPVQQIQLSQQ